MKCLLPFLALAVFVHPSLSKADKKFYVPIVKDVEGWTIEYDPQLLTKENKAFSEEVTKALANHLQRIKYILREDKVKALQTLPIRLDLRHELGNMQYHPDRKWLIEHGYDPKLEKRVHLPRAQSLLNRGTWAKHPYVILHELALTSSWPPDAQARSRRQLPSFGLWDEDLLRSLPM